MGGSIRKDAQKLINDQLCCASHFLLCHLEKKMNSKHFILCLFLWHKEWDDLCSVALQHKTSLRHLPFYAKGKGSSLSEQALLHTN